MIEIADRLKALARKVFSKLRLLLGQRRVILYCDNRIYLRKTEAYADLLRRRGFCAEAHFGYNAKTKAMIQYANTLWVIFGGRLIPPARMPKDYIFYVADPIDQYRKHNYVNEQYFQVLGKAQQAWGYAEINRADIGRLGLPFFYVPFGYAPHYEISFRRNLGYKKVQQDIDVLFFGQLSPRRHEILERLKQQGLKVVVLDASCPAYGRQLDRLLARSKMVLVIFYYDEKEPQTRVPDFARIDHLLANHIFVLHETPAVDYEAHGFLENIRCCSYEDMPQVCLHLSKNPEERAQWAERGAKWFKVNYHLDHLIPYDALREQIEKMQ
jgi:hypothetical protein